MEDLPSRWQAMVFQWKATAFRVHRGFKDVRARVPRYLRGNALADGVVIAEKRSLLWREIRPADFALTAGKVENLRQAARRFHGVEIPAGGVWSFWKQLGRATASRGFTTGRELREGCMVPAVGGGLCQISGLIYQAALDSGLQIVERHGHSRIVAGSSAEQNLDATVFWNYVDLRLKSDADWRMEVELSASELIVRIKAKSVAMPAPTIQAEEVKSRSLPSGDCLTCGMVSCFRHPSALAENAPTLGHSSFLLDARWPEFDLWCAGLSRDGDHWFLPLDGHRWKKRNYQWTPKAGTFVKFATGITLWRSLRQRRLPNQGAERQRILLEGDAALAKRYADMIDPMCRHVVVSQNLLPHLWNTGALSGRSFDVLVERWPIRELQRRLDEAKQAHPTSRTLADFRADPGLMRAEHDALECAAKLVTPHRAIADFFGDRSRLIDWELPPPVTRVASDVPSLFFPASLLGRKGAFELADALRGEVDVELKYIGRAAEGVDDLFDGVRCKQSDRSALASAVALVLPAWIEHQPRLALLALASGIPVVATADCGLPDHPQLHPIERSDVGALRDAIRALL